MDIAALITWLITALGGLVMLSIWISRGGARAGSSFPPALIFGHFLLAGTGLVLWIVYLAADSQALAWIAFAILLAVATLGFTMFAKWLGSRTRASVPAGETDDAGAEPSMPPEARFPIAIVAGHGLLAAVTLVLVFLAALEVGT